MFISLTASAATLSPWTPQSLCVLCALGSWFCWLPQSRGRPHPSPPSWRRTTAPRDRNWQARDTPRLCANSAPTSPAKHVSVRADLRSDTHESQIPQTITTAALVSVRYQLTGNEILLWACQPSSLFFLLLYCDMVLFMIKGHKNFDMSHFHMFVYKRSNSCRDMFFFYICVCHVG